MKLIKKLITYNRKADWTEKAKEFLEVIKSHPCSAFFKTQVPLDFEEFYLKIKDPRDIGMVEEKLCKNDYPSLKEFIKDFALIWTNFKEYYKPSSFFHKQARSIEVFMTHLIKEEGVFDIYSPDGQTKSGRSKRINYREKVEESDFEENEEIDDDDEEEKENKIEEDCKIIEKDENEMDDKSAQNEGVDNFFVIIDNINEENSQS